MQVWNNYFIYRKAILKGLTLKENLKIPNEITQWFKIKKQNKNLEIIINGGIVNCEQIRLLIELWWSDDRKSNLSKSIFLAEIENFFNNDNVPTRAEVAEKLVEYVKDEVKKGTRINQIMRHTVGLYHGQNGATDEKIFER